MISYSYPTLQQAEEAGMNLLPQLVGQQDRNISSMVQDCFALAGYGLSLGLPVPHLVAQFGFPDQELADGLKPLTFQEGAAIAIDWKQILKLALQFIVNNLL